AHGWELCPPGRADQAIYDNKAIWEVIRKLATRTTTQRVMAVFSRPMCDQNLQVPPILHPVRKGDVKTSDDNNLRSASDESTSEIVSKIFATAKYGLVPLQDFATESQRFFAARRLTQCRGYSDVSIFQGGSRIRDRLGLGGEHSNPRPFHA